jgi:hypothetical protein
MFSLPNTARILSAQDDNKNFYVKVGQVRENPSGSTRIIPMLRAARLFRD